MAQNLRGFPYAVLGLGMSKHSSPLLIEDLHPLQGHFFPAVVGLGRPVDPFIKDGMLFGDILKFLNFPRQVIEDV